MSKITCKYWDIFLRLTKQFKGHYIFINPSLTSKIDIDTATPELYNECLKVLSELGYLKSTTVTKPVFVPELVELNPYPTYLMR